MEHVITRFITIFFIANCCALLCYKAGKERKIGAIVGLLLGFFLGLLGMIIVYRYKKIADDNAGEIYPSEELKKYDELRRYKNQLNDGAITKEEYDIQKSRLLKL